MKNEAADGSFLSRSNFQEIMSKSLGDLATNNVKIKKRKREMVSDSDSDISKNTKKNKKKKLNGVDVEFSLKQEIKSDTEDYDFIGKSKKHKKSTNTASIEENCESNVEEPVRRKKSGKSSDDFSSVLINKSLLEVEDNNTFSDEVKRKKSKKSKKQDTDQEEDVQDNGLIFEVKKPKKSKTRTDNAEIVLNNDDVKQKMKITSKDNDLLPYSSNFVNGNDEEVEAYLKKINCAGALSNSFNEEEPTQSNRKEFCKEHSSSRRKSINPASAEYSRTISNILSDFENKNESLKKVCCEDSYINSLDSNSSVFIVQIPINLDPTELVGKEISFVKTKKIKTGDGKYITTSSHMDEPVMLTTNSQIIRLHPTHVVTLERDCKMEDSETFNAANFADNFGVNVIDPASLTRKNPIIGLEKEECKIVLSSSVESKLKAAEKMYKKYKNKKIKKLSTQDGIKQENIKDEEIFKYLSQPSRTI